VRRQNSQTEKNLSRIFFVLSFSECINTPILKLKNLGVGTYRNKIYLKSEFLEGLGAFAWMWHPAELHFFCAKIYLLNSNILAFGLFVAYIY